MIAPRPHIQGAGDTARAARCRGVSRASLALAAWRRIKPAFAVLSPPSAPEQSAKGSAAVHRAPRRVSLPSAARVSAPLVGRDGVGG